MEPVGPEEPRTYWIRRAVVGGVVLIVVIAVVALVAALAGGDDGQTAEPPPPTGPSLQPAESPTPTASSSDESSSSDKPSSSDKSSSSDKPSSSDKSSSSDKESDKKSDKESSSKSSTSKPSKKESSKAAKPAACKPADLRTTLTGPRTVKSGKEVTFQAGVINGGSATCTFTLDPETYEFRVYSGSDKIWTTDGCKKWQPKVEATLKPQADVTWKIKWKVQRSKGCDLVDSELRAGTYAANSLVDGAKPAQLVMQLK